VLRQAIEPGLTVPVVAELDCSGHIGSESTEAINHGVIERAEGWRIGSHLGHMGPGLVGVVVDEDEAPHPAVGSRPGHGGVGPPAKVWGVGRDPTVVRTGGLSTLRPLGSEETEVRNSSLLAASPETASTRSTVRVESKRPPVDEDRPRR
jgi:hypothetical protein